MIIREVVGEERERRSQRRKNDQLVSDFVGLHILLLVVVVILTMMGGLIVLKYDFQKRIIHSPTSAAISQYETMREEQQHHVELNQQERQLLRRQLISNRKIEWLTRNWRNQQMKKPRPAITKDDASSSIFSPHKHNVHVLQIANERYRETYRANSLLNKKWSHCAGYHYHLIDLVEESDCVFTNKVSTINNFFSSLRDGEWMIFVDMDAYFQSPNCDELDQVLSKEQSIFDDLQQQHHESSFSPSSSVQCDAIFHMTSAGINSGILIVKKTPSTSKWIDMWHSHQLTRGFCIGPGDQWALQETLLKFYNLDTIDDCLKLGAGPTNFSSRGRCSRDKLNNIKRQSEEYFFQNVPDVRENYSQYIQNHNNYTLIPLLGTTNNVSSLSNNHDHNYNQVCVFDCLSSQSLQCKDCNLDNAAKALHPEDGTLACMRYFDGGQLPLFHHGHDV